PISTLEQQARSRRMPDSVFAAFVRARCPGGGEILRGRRALRNTLGCAPAQRSLTNLPCAKQDWRMSEIGKSHIVIMWTVSPENGPAGDQLCESHGKWMTGHPREGDAALLDYSSSKGPELENPVDPNSAPTGNTIFVLDEFYESPAGVVEHWRQAVETWQDLPAFMAWTAKGKKVVTLHSGTVVQALW